MFTGLVEQTGVVRRRERRRGAQRMRFETTLGPLALGESINVHGVCLTVDTITPDGFEADLSSETLARSTLGDASAGTRVHLERATPLGARMGGHVVLGHVDGVGTVVSRLAEDGTVRLEVRAPWELARYFAAKGSVAVDGVSLTLNGVADEGREAVRFDVMLVPHTLARTALGDLATGGRVNLEVDVLARYVQRQLELGLAG